MTARGVFAGAGELAGKGARGGIFGYGRDGHVDVDYARYDYGDEPGPGGRP